MDTIKTISISQSVLIVDNRFQIVFYSGFSYGTIIVPYITTVNHKPSMIKNINSVL